MVLNIFKQTGWTSFDVVAKLRTILKTKKIGHAGTLDPLAEGVLVVLTDKDTKKQDQVTKLEKQYLAEVAFGATTKSYDLETELNIGSETLSTDEITSKLASYLPKYIGEIQQKVPAYSAVKVKGSPLYKKARKQGVDDKELPIKTVKVVGIEIRGVKTQEFSGVTLPVVTFDITCSKGFYVRSFANDLGKDLGIGGVLTKLTRTRVGEYEISDAKRISEINPV